MKTYSAKPVQVKRAWYVVDASEIPLGRLSTRVASLLMGKGKTMYTAHIDCGDYVVVINAKNLVVTGNKLKNKKYYKHTGYPGGINEKALEDKLAENPASIIEKSVKGMLPVNKLRADRMKRLKVYASSEHNHTAQSPKSVSLKEHKQ